MGSSLGSLTTGGGIQVVPGGYVYFQPSNTTSWAWMNNTFSPNQYSKNYIVTLNNTEQKFFVLGTGQVYSNGQYYFSDSIYKEDIEQIDNALEKIKRLRGVSFSFKNFFTADTITTVDKYGITHTSITPDPNEDDLHENPYVSEVAKPFIIAERSRKHLGFIAQETEEALPEVVRTVPDGTKAIAYQEIIALCVEAIKELDAKIDENEFLKNEIIRLTIETNELEERIFELEKNKNVEVIENQNINNYDEPSAMPTLYQNQPNPFYANTQIGYYLPSNTKTAYIKIYNLQGSQLKSHKIIERGNGSIELKGSEFNPGIYIYGLIIDEELIDTKRMILTD